MPTYHFKCEDKECEHVTVVTQKYEDSDPVCEKCGNKKVVRLIVKSSFVLKGSGWFNTGGY